MIRVVAIVLISLCGCGPFVAVRSQTSPRDPSDVLKQLLALPAPTPLIEIPESELPKQRPDNFFAKDNPPPDDATVEDLIDYWDRLAYVADRLPSDTVRQRLLDALLDQPQLLAKLVRFSPQNEAAAAKIKNRYDEWVNEQQLNPYDLAKIKDWLLYNSSFFLNELVALARKAKDDEEVGYIAREYAVVALANLNWELAEPLIRNLLASAQPRSSTLALSLFYERAIEQNDSTAEDRYRKTLKTIASDRNQPGYARNIAIKVLCSTEWSDRDEWYMGLFHDETLIHSPDGNSGFSPLTIAFRSNPAKWIPIMTRLLESKEVTVRSAAAACLMTVDDPKLRRAALLPLLPWLSNPAWLTDELNNRRKLIQTMKSADMPESVPGLIWSLENSSDSDDGYERNYAAAALATYMDPRAVPALKKALAKEKDEYHRRSIVESLIACQGLTDAEQLEALEAYAAKLTTPEGREQMEHFRSGGPLPPILSIGRYLSTLTTAPESLSQIVLIRAENLKSSAATLAQVLLEIAHRWQSRQVELDIINRIGNGSADVSIIKTALERRVALQEKLRPELHALSAESGSAQGIAVALLEDPSLVQGVLGSEDEFAQIALLACSRLTQASLPVGLVGPLLSSKNSLLSDAARAYLLVEDSRDAREFLWKHHPNQAFITGWTQRYQGPASKWETRRLAEKLRAELFTENGPVEIIALLYRSEVSQVIRIYSDKATYIDYEDTSRYRERNVPPAEISSLKDFLTVKGIADFGPQFQFCYHGCPSYEFFTITKEKGRRVYTQQVTGLWEELQERFAQLGRSPDAKLHYNLEKEIKGLEVLYADKHLAVRDVWKQGDEIRMYLEREATKEETEQKVAESVNEDDEEDEDEAVRTERWRRKVAINNAVFSWRVYANNKVGEVTSEPGVFSTIDENKFPPDEKGNSVLEYDLDVRKLTSDSIVIARNTDGLWKQVAGSRAVRIGEGAYKDPVVTPDGKWVVVAKGDEDWYEPNYIVRFNLRTGREYRVSLDPADRFNPIAYVPPHGKVLLRRAKDFENKKSVGPDRVEYYLVDPATGETRLVSGEFEPLNQKGRRFLQPTEKPGEYWAALPDQEKNQTQVGRYNLKDFTFKPVLTFPHIVFSSMTMWVDEKQNKVYVVYRNQLLRLPLALPQ